MARYERTYTGEHRTRLIGIKLTPSEHGELAAAADADGVPISAYVRDLCLRRPATVVAATRRNPEAKALLYELNAIGNNLNQLARRANIHDAMPDRADLDAALEMLKRVMAHVLAL